MIKLCLLPSVQNIHCQNQETMVKERSFQKSSLFMMMFVRLCITLQLFFFLVNNRTVPKDQIKTLTSQTKLTRKYHNHGLHYFLQSFTVSYFAIPGQRSCTLRLTANSYFISWLRPNASPPKSGKLCISAMKTKIKTLNYLLQLA